MPRFEDAHVAALKRAMLPRLPGCLYAEEDYARLVAESGLNEIQIEHWAEHFRYRTPVEEREAFLRAEGSPEKVDPPSPLS